MNNPYRGRRQKGGFFFGRMRACAVYLIRSVYSLATRLDAGVSFYHFCARILFWLCGRSWFQLLWANELRLVGSFLPAAGLFGVELTTIKQRSLMGHLWRKLWSAGLNVLSMSDLDLLVRVAGLEHLQAANASGRGVLMVHYHALFTRVFWTWLARNEIEPGHTVWHWTKTEKIEAMRNPLIRILQSTRDLKVADELLRQGGLVHILPDGVQGDQPLLVPFCKRVREFQPSFAELALNSQAAILPVVTGLEPDGSISIEIKASLAHGLSHGERSQQVQSLVHKYAEHLSYEWSVRPADLMWRTMWHHAFDVEHGYADPVEPDVVRSK